MNKYQIVFCGAVLFSSCVHAAEKIPPQTELLEFAKVNCLLQYFQKKGYDMKDIRAICGGIVELGTAAAEQYEQISLLVKNYRPPLKTKQNIDIDLLKCFKLEQDVDFLHAVSEIK